MTKPPTFKVTDRVIHPQGVGVIVKVHPRPGDGWADDLEIRTDDGLTFITTPHRVRHATTTPGVIAMTDLTTDHERLTYVLTLDGRELARFPLSGSQDDPGDPDAPSRSAAIAAVRHFQADGLTPEAWLLTDQQVTDLEHGRIVVADLAATVAPLPVPDSPAEPEADSLTFHVYGVKGDTRTLLAAFPTVLDALTWQDHLSSEPPLDPSTSYDRYEVPGIEVPPWELEPFLQAAKSVTPKGGPS